MKKRLLFSLLAIFLAGLGLGGVSMAAVAPETLCDEDALVCIGEAGYSTIASAIEAYDGNGEILIKKTNSVAENLTTNKDVTINLDGNKINACVTVDGGVLTIKDKEDNSGEIVCGSYIFNVNAGTLKMYGGTYENGVDVRVKTANAKAEIYGGVYKANDGNTAAVWAYNGGVINIYDGTFIGKPGTEKDGKCFWAGGGQAAGDTNGTVNISGGSFDGRISASEGSVYHIGGGNFGARNVAKTPECSEFVEQGQPINEQPGCQSTNLDAFLVEGYVVSSEGGRYVVIYDPVATIGENGYSTVDAAISAATEGQTVEILKAGTYPFPATISVANLTIKGNVDGVVFTHDYADNNGIISTIANGITFENVGFNLTNNSSSTANHYFKQTAGTVIMSGCTINGLIHTMGDMQFDNCTFITNVGYNIWTQIGNVTFNGGEIINNASSRLVNVYQHNGTNPGNNRYTITFNGTKFTNNGSAGKGALNIHEVADQTIKYVLQYTINMDNVTTEGTFATDKPGYLPYFSVEDIIVGIVTDGVAADLKGSPTASDVSSGTLNGGDIVVKVDGVTKYTTPKAGQSQRTVTFDGTNTGVVNNGDKVEKPADPAAQSCKSFVEWQLNGVAYDFNSVVTGNLALTSKWNSTCSSSSSSSSSSNKTGDNNTGATAESGTTAETGANTPTVDPQGVAANGYTNEMNEAYEFAYANGITTMKSIDEAEMLDGLTRIAMAKMLSQYAINVLGKTPADVEVPNFDDVTSELDAEYANGVTLAYKLGIMGINMPDNKFLPYETVTRAQFGTALSRLLFGIEDGEDAYYTTHLAKLKEAGIITNDDPTLEELRGYVMLMLMRSSK